MTTKADGSTVTSCRVPRGREYRVRFDRNGEAVAVETVYRRWNDTGRVSEVLGSIRPVLNFHTLCNVTWSA